MNYTFEDIEKYQSEHGMEVYMRGICKHRNPAEDYDCIIIGIDGLSLVMRNQGKHDPRFFPVQCVNTEEAVAAAEKLFNTKYTKLVEVIER